MNKKERYKEKILKYLETPIEFQSSRTPKEF